MYTSETIPDSQLRAQAYELAIKCKQATIDVPNGYAIDLDGIEGVDATCDGKGMTPKEVLDTFFEKGVLIYRSEKGNGTKQSCPIIQLGSSEKVIDARPLQEIADEIYTYLTKQA